MLCQMYLQNPERTQVISPNSKPVGKGIWPPELVLASINSILKKIDVATSLPLYSLFLT